MIIKRTPNLLGKMPKASKPRPKYRISVFKDVGNCWRWHMRSLIGKRSIVFTAGESFASRGNALRAARRVRALLAVPTEFDFEMPDPKGTRV